MILLITLFLIITEAVYEGLSDRGLKPLAGVLEFIYKAFITLSIFAWLCRIDIYYTSISYWYIIGGYLLLRFALFDYTYNLVVGNPLFYLGDTKYYDKLLGGFFRWSGIPPEHFLFMFRLIAICIGVSWLV